MKTKSRIMYIEYKGESIIGQARIGWVKFSKSGKSIYHQGKTLETLKGTGYKANYFDTKTGDHYWVSGCRKDGMDALYNTTVEIDENAREEYWVKIRNKPEHINTSSFRARGK